MAEEIAESRPYHEDRIKKLDAILSTLNPEFAEKQVQKAILISKYYWDKDLDNME